MKRSVAACALAVVTLCGCAGTTNGRGRAESPTSAPSRPDFPSVSVTASAPTSSSPASSSSVSPSPTMQQRAARLRVQTNGAAHEVVAVRGGAEAATYDGAGHIAFWRSTGGSADWTRLDSSRYPAEVTGRPYHVAVRGTLLTGMTHATYIVTGQFTNDNSGRAVAYTGGRAGWGAIKAEANGNIGPSGQPVGADRIGLSYDFGFVGGLLKTEDCPSDEPISSCDSDHVDKLWTWTGHDFKRS
jgi:hypothetical protein